MGDPLKQTIRLLPGYCTSLAQGVYGSRVTAEALIDQVIISDAR